MKTLKQKEIQQIIKNLDELLDMTYTSFVTPDFYKSNKLISEIKGIVEEED